LGKKRRRKEKEGKWKPARKRPRAKDKGGKKEGESRGWCAGVTCKKPDRKKVVFLVGVAKAGK